MKIINKITNWIHREINQSMRQTIANIERTQLSHTADLTELIIDLKVNKISFGSREFLMRMNIDPDELIKLIRKE